MWVWSLSFAVLQMCVWSVDTHCVHTQNSLSVFTTLGTAVLSSLHSDVVFPVVKLTFCLHQNPFWLGLVWTNSPVFTPPGYRSVGTNNAQTPLYPKYLNMRQVNPDSTISKVLTVLKWWMIIMLNRKLLEKQGVQNRFASYEVHIGHFFYNVNATVRFGKAV